MIYGIDVSHFQSTVTPGGVAWSGLARTARFVIVRATYGTYRDPSAVAHVRAARLAGMWVGLYHFFRSTQPMQDQLTAFYAQAAACGIKIGDICPAIDIEDDPKVSTVSPAWSSDAERMTTELVDSFGECLVYLTQRDFGRLGKPAWVLERPLWTAHYTGAAKPATPGDKPCVIWQHRVGPYQMNGPGGVSQPQLLDQDRALLPIPSCARLPDDAPNGAPPEHTHDGLTDARAASLAAGLMAGLDLSHDAPVVS